VGWAEDWHDLIRLEFAVRRAGCVLLVGFDNRLYCWPKRSMPDELATECKEYNRELVKLLRFRSKCRDIPAPPVPDAED
jgi:hypothetical protein